MKAVTVLPLETLSHPYPCNPIQGHWEAGVCPSMHRAGGVLLITWLTRTDQHTHKHSWSFKSFKRNQQNVYVIYFKVALNENQVDRFRITDFMLVVSLC